MPVRFYSGVASVLIVNLQADRTNNTGPSYQFQRRRGISSSRQASLIKAVGVIESGRQLIEKNGKVRFRARWKDLSLN